MLCKPIFFLRNYSLNIKPYGNQRAFIKPRNGPYLNNPTILICALFLTDHLVKQFLFQVFFYIIYTSEEMVEFYIFFLEKVPSFFIKAKDLNAIHRNCPFIQQFSIFSINHYLHVKSTRCIVN